MVTSIIRDYAQDDPIMRNIRSYLLSLYSVFYYI